MTRQGAIIGWTPEQLGVFTILDFDVVTSENHSVDATVTEHAVERGADITDYVVPGLLKLSLGLFMTETPIRPVTPTGLSPDTINGAFSPMSFTTRSQRPTGQVSLSGPGYADTGVSGLVPGFPKRVAAPITASGRGSVESVETTTGTFLQFPEELTRTTNAYTALIDLCRRGIAVDVSTELRHYPKMLITSVKAPVTVEHGVEFVVELTEFREVDIVVTRLTPRKRKPKLSAEAGRCEPPNKNGANTGRLQPIRPQQSVTARLTGIRDTPKFRDLLRRDTQ